MKLLPNYLVIGVQRSATTWLFECLKEHPDIFLPNEKELHYFDENYEKGAGWYNEFFKNRKKEKILGEISPNYFHKPHAIDRIASDLPGCKLQIIFRNPVDRAFSAYNLYHDRFRGLSFLDAFEKNHVLRDIGLYSKHFKYISEKMPDKIILVGLYDEVKSSPNEFIRKTYEFLGVEPLFSPASLNKTYNKIIFPEVQSFIDNLGMGNALEWFKETKLGVSLKNTMRKSGGAATGGPRLSSSVRYKVYSFYKDDINQLEELIDRDLSSWKV